MVTSKPTVRTPAKPTARPAARAPAKAEPLTPQPKSQPKAPASKPQPKAQPQGQPKAQSKSPVPSPSGSPPKAKGKASKPKVNPIPAGYHSITPYLVVDGAQKAIDFYVRALGATELFRMPRPDGKIGHAEVKFGDSPVMLADEHPEIGARGPRSCGGSPVSVLLYVDDVDKIVKRALAAGAKLLRPVENQFYGDRSGIIEDPFGHKWSIATHVEDLTPADIEERQKKAQG